MATLSCGSEILNLRGHGPSYKETIPLPRKELIHRPNGVSEPAISGGQGWPYVYRWSFKARTPDLGQIGRAVVLKPPFRDPFTLKN